MKLSHVTLKDPTLPHQVVFFFSGVSGIPCISCNCRRKPDGSHSSMGRGPNIEAARALYNDPVNHRISFNRGDEAKW